MRGKTSSECDSMWNLSYNIKFNYAGLRRLYRCKFFSHDKTEARCSALSFRIHCNFTTSHFYRTPASNWNIYLWLDVIIQFSNEFGSISFLNGGYTMLFFMQHQNRNCHFFSLLRSTMQFVLQIRYSVSCDAFIGCAMHSNSSKIVLTSGINLYSNQKRTMIIARVCEYV